jgi:microcin C transport system substrate-binding protein
MTGNSSSGGCLARGKPRKIAEDSRSGRPLLHPASFPPRFRSPRPFGRRTFLAGAAAALAATQVPARALAAGEIHKAHAIAMHGDPKYGPDFTHFDYTDPAAPKGGNVRFAAIGTFDSFNPFIIRGTAAAGVGGIYETLTISSTDEAFTQYGLLAETIEWPEDRSWVAFELRPAARWWDGTPVSAEDVVFSFDLLKTKGDPFYRYYYASVEKAEISDDRRVKFTFVAGDNHELPLIVGQMFVLPKHYWDGRDFEKPTLDVPLGSGSYKVVLFEPGRFIVYERVADYWGADLPVNLGKDNWGTIRYDYYRDEVVALEAFKAGNYDFRQESTAKVWATGYDIPQVADGRIIKELIPNEEPTGMQGFIYNTRRPIFQDRRVRQALGYAFDFEWSNKALFYGQYTRTKSYFSNTELASRDLPEGEEVETLERFRGKIPDEVFTTVFAVPTTDGSGNVRDNLLKGRALLVEAGWVVRDRELVKVDTGEPFGFEILLYNPQFERLCQAFVQNLKRLGIVARIRTVDVSQYQNRLNDFDFDMFVGGFGESLSPGNEQREFWGSAAADTPGSRNVIGIKDPTVDALVDLVISAKSRESLIARTRALDRVLLWGFYVIPQYHIQAWRVAYWDKFGHPAKPPKYDLGLDGWWIDAAKAAALKGLASG